jgi:beta-mannosidase
MRFLILLVFAVLISTCQTQISISPTRVPLNDWQFSFTKDSIFLDAPYKNIHLDLLHHRIIPDPYYSSNEKKLKWIEEKDWIYQTYFSLNLNELEKEKIYLFFEGLDTYAKVYLNDHLILKSKNMFLKHKVDVKEYVQNYNFLRIEFCSAIKTAEHLYDAHQVRLPAGNDRNDKATSVFTRKAPYQYGWDWGPRLVGAAIWKPIYLEFWDKMDVKKDRVYQHRLKDDIAELGVKIELESPNQQKLKIELYKNNKLYKTEYFPVQSGINSFDKIFAIENPNLWWPVGYGEACLYDFKLVLTGKDLHWEKDYKIGFRDIQLERKADDIGESFQFVVNGVPIYAKGANYIPQDIFPDRVSEEDYQKTIQLALEANMNMLRVWGGGIYQMDKFYELCDEKGILVWQDFMFACSLYPGDETYLNNVEAEATYQIKRIRDHASLALWCGNNEMNELWHNWGYQKAFNYSEQDSIDTWNDYLKVFDKMLPQLVNQLDPKTSYLESSPLYGWGRDESMTHGDSHYWGIWWGKQPFEMYEEKIPRFSSEFGFQSIPHLNTVLRFTDASQLDLFSEDMKAHQKSSIGNQTILDYLPNYFPEPTNFEEMIYISQLLQAYGMDLAFRAQRLAKPRCMGTLYWQLNDCWPGLSWSSLDYFGQKKATHYVAEEDFATFLLKSEIKNNQLKTSIVSDSLKDIKAQLLVSVITFSGDTLKQFEKVIEVKANQVSTYEIGKVNLRSFNPAKALIYSKLQMENQVFADRIDFFEKPKDMIFPESELVLEQIGENTFKLSSSPAVFNYKVYLSTKEFGNFDPNFFYLLPGEEKVFRFIQNKSDNIIDITEIQTISLNQIYK